MEFPLDQTTTDDIIARVMDQYDMGSIIGIGSRGVIDPMRCGCRITRSADGKWLVEISTIADEFPLPPPYISSIYTLIEEATDAGVLIAPHEPIAVWAETARIATELLNREFANV